MALETHTSLDQFQIAPTLPVGDGFLVLFDFPAARSDEVLDEVFAEIFMGKGTLFKQIGGDSEVASQSFDLAAGNGLRDGRGIIGVALQARGQFELVLDAIEAAGQQGGEDEVEV